MRVRRHLIVAQSASILVTMLTAVVAIVALEATARNAERVGAGLALDLALADRLRYDAERLATTSRGYLLSGQDEYREHFRESVVQFDSTLERVADAYDAAATALIERDANDYKLAVERGAEQRALTDDSHVLVTVFDDLQPKRLALEHRVDELASREQGRFDAARQHGRRLARKAQLVVVITSLMALGLSTGLATYFIRTLVRQVRRIEDATNVAERISTSREELLAVVSHDLRNPLHAIMLATSLVRMGSNVENCVDTIDNAAERMQRLIDDLLDTAGIENGTIELRRANWSARALVEDSLKLFRSSASKRGVTLRVESTGAETLFVDRDRILQVFSNLIGNALKFVEPGGEIVVRARPDAGHVRFEVDDNGHGIPAEQLRRVFDRYYRGHRDTEHAGVGLGLYICKRLVQAHHGAIGVDSAVGKGTTFWFTLPTERAEQVVAPVESSPR